MRRSIVVLVMVAAIAAALAVAGAAAPPVGARTLARGIADDSIATMPPDEQTAALREIATGLRATEVRLDCKWSLAEPAQGVFDETGYLARVLAAVTTARADGLQVIVTVYSVPRWASDRTFWAYPPSSAYSGYCGFHPPTPAALDDFQAFTTHLATLLKGRVFGYEPWNEPNLWPFLYPQFTTGDPCFASHVHLSLLKRFRAGVRAADPAARIIAGSTPGGGGRWLTVATTTSGADGDVSARVALRATVRFRVAWQGVVVSPAKLVRAQ